MTVKLLAEQDLESLSSKGVCTGGSESILFKMPHCWKSHVTTQINLSFGIMEMDFQCKIFRYSKFDLYILTLE